jgi:hypothetical protein
MPGSARVRAREPEPAQSEGDAGTL